MCLFFHLRYPLRLGAREEQEIEREQQFTIYQFDPMDLHTFYLVLYDLGELIE